MSSRPSLCILFAFCLLTAAEAFAKGWKEVKLLSSVTHVQPMTGLVLWPHAARERNATYGESIQLEFAYCLPCKVVTGCTPDGTISYDWTWFDKILDDVASRNHQLVARFRYEYPGSRDVDGKTRGMTAVPQYIKERSDYHETYNDVPGDGPTFYADWNNAELQRFTKQFYTDFSRRYNNDPRLAFLEVGFGHWSEYHIFGTELHLGKNFASKDFQAEFFLHLDSVMDKIPWLISIDGGDKRYSPIVENDDLMKLTFGLFDDSFMHKNHENGFNERLWNAIGQGIRWQGGVCGGEVSYYSRDDQRDFLNPAGLYGHTWEEQAAKYHITFMISNDAPRGNYGTAARFKEASMAAGYHFTVTKCRTRKHETEITVTNTGVAPLYRDAYFSIDGTRSETTLKGLLPGQEMTITIPTTLPRNAAGYAKRQPEIISDALLPTQRIEYDFLLPREK